MIRNIITYLIIILAMCGVFAFYTNSLSTADDNYQNVKKNMYAVSESAAYVESLSYRFDKAVVKKNEDINNEFFEKNGIDCFYALLINDSDDEVIAAKNANKRMYPASMTKIMTGIVVCEKIEKGEISLSDVVTVDKYYDLTSEGVEPFGFSTGTTITVKNLLYALMIESNNYYALILADYIAGSEAAFVELMNEKALSIGATNTHYMNPHGLDDPNHYTTAYDTYLILAEAYKHEIMREIDSYSEGYSYSYSNESIGIIDDELYAYPTCLFFSNEVELPAGFEIQVWKTGTTDGAGYCLSMYLKKNDKYYFIVCGDGYSKLNLYNNMVELLCLIK